MRRVAVVIVLTGLLAGACTSPERAPAAATPEDPPAPAVEAEPPPDEDVSSEESYDVPWWTPEGGTAEVVPPLPKPPPEAKEPERARRGGRPDREEMIRRFDKDGDGTLSEEERAAARAARGGGPSRRPR